MKSWTAPALPSVPGPLPPLVLHDTASGELKATSADPVQRLYVCGITPYDATHLGHAATYLAFDLIHRYWLAAGVQVRYVQNVTDVDDPLLERAARDGIDWRTLAHEQTDLFRSDMQALRVLPPGHYVGVVEVMDQVAVAVDALLATGAAYRVDDPEHPDIYFDISATGRFGSESGYDEATMLALSAERGGDPDRPGKRHRLDPLLWRLERPGEPSWESPMGRGRAGWHIECSVIATSLLGPTIDVQGGGSDLIFPHHECSAAHAEALTGEFPFAGHYVHTGLLAYQGEKMSKSLGNLVFVSKLTAAGADPAAIRLALLDGHYRQDREWTSDMLDSAERRLTAWRAAADSSGAAAGSADPGQGTVRQLAQALANDLDTSAAVAIVDRWASDPRGEQAVPAAVDALLGIDLGAQSSGS